MPASDRIDLRPNADGYGLPDADTQDLQSEIYGDQLVDGLVGRDAEPGWLQLLLAAYEAGSVVGMHVALLALANSDPGGCHRIASCTAVAGVPRRALDVQDVTFAFADEYMTAARQRRRDLLAYLWFALHARAHA